MECGVNGDRAMRRPGWARRTSAYAGIGVAMFALAACSGGGNAPQTFDLVAPRGAGLGIGGGTIVVAEPLAITVYDSERMVVRTRENGVSYLPGAQWADRLPRLVQARLIQTFENGMRGARVGRPGDRLVAAYQLNTELRRFDILEDGRVADVTISAKLVDDRSGRIIRAQVFSAQAPAAAISGPEAATALDQAAGQVFQAIARWASGARG